MGRQVSSVVGHEGSILVVTGPSRSSAAVERLQGPGFGREKVDDGTLHASIVAPLNAGTAIELLHQYCATGRPVPLRSY